MSKAILSLILVAMIGLSLSTNCNDGSTCSLLNTCCAVPSGYACCPFPSGVCCLDGTNCCPNGYFCQNNKCNAPTGKASSLFLAIGQQFTALVPQIVATPSLGTIAKCITDIPPLVAAVAQIVNNIKAGNNSGASALLPQLGLNANALITDCASIINLAPKVSAALIAKFPSVPDLNSCLNDIKPVYNDVTQIIQAITSKNTVAALAVLPQLQTDVGTLIVQCEKVIIEMI